MSIIPKIKLNKENKDNKIMPKPNGYLQSNKNDYNGDEKNKVPFLDNLKQKLFINK